MPDKKEPQLLSYKEKNCIQMKEEYRYWKSRNRCVACHKVDAFTMIGRGLCADCRDAANARGRKRNRIYAEQISAKAKAKRDQRREAHCCTECGQKLPDGYSFLTCDKCRWNTRRRGRKARERKTGIPFGAKGLWGELGLCARCGKEFPPGTKADGEPRKLCERCYADAVKGACAARAARAEKKEVESVASRRGQSWIAGL